MTWTETRLKHLARESIRNGLGESGQEGDLDWPRYIRTTDIAGPRQLRTDIRASLPPQVAHRSPLRAGDIVMTAAGATIGKSMLYCETETACYAGYLAKFSPKMNVDPRFVAFWMQSVPYWAQIEKGKVVSTIENFSASKYANLVLKVPPLAEQRAIADYLDVETARIDALIAKKQQLIDLLEERLDALVDLLFEPGSNEPITRLARLAQIRSGVTLNSNSEPEDSLLLPYLRVANVQPGWLNLDEVKQVSVSAQAAERCALKYGDVLMTEGGDIDKLGRGTVWRSEIEPCLHQNHVFAVRPDPQTLDSDYLAMLTQTSHARSYFESTGVQSTNLASTNSAKVGDLRVPALSIGEQRRRVDEHVDRSRPLTTGTNCLTRQITLLAERRQALITAAVTGEFAVPGAP